MAWGGINSNARTELVFIQNGSLTANRYIEEVHHEHIVPFVPHIGENFVLMHDNARLHAAHCVSNFLEEVGIVILYWPVRSPGLNPIQHVWDMLGKRLQQRYFTTVDELKIALIEEWEAIPQDDIRAIRSYFIYNKLYFLNKMF